ncbi:MAG: CRISPR-associated endonuclease Cas2, partial [Isosphaeraceae bacterium]
QPDVPHKRRASQPDVSIETEPTAPDRPTTDNGPAKMDTYVVAYDICDPKRLRKVARACEDFGLRRQFSVFFCRLAAVDVVRLKARLYDVINLDQDQVLFIPICARCAAEIEALGRPVEAYDARDVVIVT